MPASPEGTESVIPPPAPAGLHLEGLWRFARPAGYRARARATAHHLIHLVDAGAYVLHLAGRACPVRAPALIWYHGGEAVGWEGGPAAVRFRSCAFACPRLDPPPAAARVVAAPPAALAAWDALFAAVGAADLPGALRAQAAACAWLEAMLAAFAHGGDDLWERVERRALATAARPRLPELAAWAGVGVSTLERACRRRHGCPPAARLRAVRAALADGLIAQGGLPRQAAARLLGYADRRSLRRAMAGAQGARKR